jgi:hypothetical protein
VQLEQAAVEEHRMFSLKMIIEAPGDAVAVEGITQAGNHAGCGHSRLLSTEEIHTMLPAKDKGRVQK